MLVFYLILKCLKNQGKTKMQCNQLQDLALAGVRWELSDVPFAMAQSAAVAAANRASHPAPTTVTPDVVPDSPAPLRAATAIVPPIAPEIGMRLKPCAFIP